MLVVVMKLIAGVTTVLLAPCITEPCMGTGKPNIAFTRGSRVGDRGLDPPRKLQKYRVS